MSPTVIRALPVYVCWQQSTKLGRLLLLSSRPHDCDANMLTEASARLRWVGLASLHRLASLLWREAPAGLLGSTLFRDKATHCLHIVSARKSSQQTSSLLRLAPPDRGRGRAPVTPPIRGHRGNYCVNCPEVGRPGFLGSKGSIYLLQLALCGARGLQLPSRAEREQQEAPASL